MNCEVSYEFKLKGESEEAPWSRMVSESVLGVPDDLSGQVRLNWIEQKTLREQPDIRMRDLHILG